MLRETMILSVGLALLLSSTIGAAPANLAALCSFHKAQLKTVAELEAIKREVDATGPECPRRVVEAITDLAAIVKDKQACRMDKAEAITRFVDTYLKQSPVEIPEALANFAVAYGMQVSTICGQEMVDVFSSDADVRIHDKLEAKDYQQYLRLKKHLVDENPVGLLLSSILNTGQLILPVDLVQVMSEIGSKEKLEIRLPESEQLNKFRGYCDNLMRPLYESTLLPLAHLNRAGFVGKVSHWRSQYKKNSRFWSTVVFWCESFKLVEAEPGKPSDQAKDAGLIHDMAMSLAAQMKRESAQLIAETPMAKYESEQQVDDKIVNRSVKSLVKNFDANKSEVNRLRERIQRRSFHIIKALLKKAKYRPMVKKLVKSVNVKGGNNEKIGAAFSTILNSAHDDRSLTRVQTEGVDYEVTAHEKKGIEWLSLFAAAFCILIAIGLWVLLMACCGQPNSQSSVTIYNF